MRVGTACLVLVMVFAAGGPASGSDIHVGCVGLESGGWGGPLGWQYAYEVSVIQTPEHVGMTGFQVGTCDLIHLDYSNVMITDVHGVPIPGWIAIWPNRGTEVKPHLDAKTPHGAVSPGPQGLTLGNVSWTPTTADTPSVPDGTTVFCGFDNPKSSHDVGWTAYIDGAMWLDENWTQPVGWGAGPVHGPVPEPATLSLLALGGLALIRRRR